MNEARPRSLLHGASKLRHLITENRWSISGCVMNPKIHAVMKMFENVSLRTDPEVQQYWSSAANGAFILAGFALAALFALLALKREDKHGPVFLVAFLLLLSSFGLLVAGIGHGVLAECTFIASEANLGQPNPNGTAILLSIYNVSNVFGFVGFASFISALAVSGFLRSWLLGVLSLAMAGASFFACFIISVAELSLFAP